MATTAHAVAAPANRSTAVRRKSPKRTEHLDEALGAVDYQVGVANLRRALGGGNTDRHIHDGECIDIGDVVAGVERGAGTGAPDQLLDCLALVHRNAGPYLQDLAAPVRDEALTFGFPRDLVELRRQIAHPAPVIGDDRPLVLHPSTDVVRRD